MFTDPPLSLALPVGLPIVYKWLKFLQKYTDINEAGDVSNPTSVCHTIIGSTYAIDESDSIFLFDGSVWNDLSITSTTMSVSPLLADTYIYIDSSGIAQYVLMAGSPAPLDATSLASITPI